MRPIMKGSWGQTLAALGLTQIGSGHTTDSTSEMMRAISNGQAILIDVREDAEWQSGHLQDAKHLALSELMRGVAAPRLNQLMPSGKIVYLHCASGGRCLKAADLLKTAGSETRPLKYGYESLLQLGMAKAK